MEIDFIQEHFNFWLEKLAQYKGKKFSNIWYRFVLAMHVHHSLQLKKEFEEIVDLAPDENTTLSPIFTMNSKRLYEFFAHENYINSSAVKI